MFRFVTMVSQLNKRNWEKIEFVNHELCNYYVLLINPLEEVSTKKIFEKLKIVKKKSQKRNQI